MRTQTFLSGMDGLRYVVFAEANSDDLAEGIASLWAAWTKLRRSVCWKRKVRGSIAVLEVTYNRKKGTWHPHLNVLMQGDYFPFRELNLAWQESTDGNGRTSRISAANEGTVYELLKYTLKVAERDKDGDGGFHLILDRPEDLDEFLTAVYGRRLIRTYGSFRGLKLSDEENPEGLGKCPDCGPDRQVSVVQLGYVQPHQLSFDFEKGVFRVARSPGQIRDRMREATEFTPDFMPCAVHPRSKTVLEKEIQRLNALIASRAATPRKGESELWQQPQ